MLPPGKSGDDIGADDDNDDDDVHDPAGTVTNVLPPAAPANAAPPATPADEPIAAESRMPEARVAAATAETEAETFVDEVIATAIGMPLTNTLPSQVSASRWLLYLPHG